MKTARGSTQTNGRGYVPMKLYLQTLKLNFMSFSHARKHYFKTLKSNFKMVFTILSSWVEASFGPWVGDHPLLRVLLREGSLPPSASCFPPANHRIPRELMKLSERRCFQKISVSYWVKICRSELNIHSTNIFKILNILTVHDLCRVIHMKVERKM